ncbi:MAG: histidine phosphatase family protein [Chloroflexota bacterium]|nr:MAG: phosphoglycerate mutase [Bellilinea sp.]
MHILYIRHAQSTNNLLWDQTGSSDGRSSDPTLSELGVKQSIALCNHFEHYLTLGSGNQPPNLDHIFLYSSLMWRSLQTAQPIADKYNLPILGVRDLHEVGGVYLKDPETELNIGLPGKKPDELKMAYPRLHFVQELNVQGWYNASYELDDQAHQRAKRLVKWLMAQHQYTNHIVVLVSHGAFFNYFMTELLGITPPYRSWFVMNNTGVTRIEVEEDQIYILYTNSIIHLPADWVS